MRLLSLDWSENWARISLCHRWRGPQKEKLDGTNNASEQVIGQAVKERYRTMRGYTRQASILNVSSLIGCMRAQGADYAMDELFTK